MGGAPGPEGSARARALMYWLLAAAIWLHRAAPHRKVALLNPSRNNRVLSLVRHFSTTSGLWGFFSRRVGIMCIVVQISLFSPAPTHPILKTFISCHPSSMTIQGVVWEITLIAFLSQVSRSLSHTNSERILGSAWSDARQSFNLIYLITVLCDKSSSAHRAAVCVRWKKKVA